MLEVLHLRKRRIDHYWTESCLPNLAIRFIAGHLSCSSLISKEVKDQQIGTEAQESLIETTEVTVLHFPVLLVLVQGVAQLFPDSLVVVDDEYPQYSQQSFSTLSSLASGTSNSNVAPPNSPGTNVRILPP